MIRREPWQDFAPSQYPQPLTVHGASRVLEVSYSDGKTFRILSELLRDITFALGRRCKAMAPGKCCRPASAGWASNTIEPIGNYAIKPFFSDGHESGSVHLGIPLPAGQPAGCPLWQHIRSAWKRPDGARDTAHAREAGAGGHGCSALSFDSRVCMSAFKSRQQRPYMAT